ncbi:hypothetical protein TNCV_2038141 [Trichonephila clavipes]|nr:hypothetical protein TNCV_2038141 [Trichonephila clavipes]
MVPLVSRRPGSVLVCFARIGLGRLRADFRGLPMRRDEGCGVDPIWCLKRFFRRREESPGWRELEESPEKKETWTVKDKDWSRKRGETMNADDVGGLESMVKRDLSFWTKD